MLLGIRASGRNQNHPQENKIIKTDPLRFPFLLGTEQYLILALFLISVKQA